MTAWIVLLGLASTGAVPVDMCVEPSFESAVAVMRLDERSPTLTLRPVRPSRCADADGYRARFQGRRGRVALVLWTPAGDRLERAIPWAARADDAIIDLSRQGRLGAVSVLLAGLVLEDRAVRATAPRSAPLAGIPPVVPVEMRGAPAGEPIGPPPATVPTLERAPPRAVGAQPDTPVSSARPSTSRGDAHPQRRTAPAATSPVPGTTAARALARALPRSSPPRRPPPPPEAAPTLDPVRPASDAPGGPGVGAQPVPAVRVAMPSRRAGAPVPSEAPRLGFRIGAAVRSPSLLGLEAALRIEAWTLGLEVGGMPTVVWALEGRPLEVGASWAAFGWSPSVWRGGAIDVDGRLSLVVERLTVLRLEYPDAVTRAIWDAGLDMATVVSAPMGDGWRIGGVLGARWLATANDVRIPQGPRAALNVWQGRLALIVVWAP